MENITEFLRIYSRSFGERKAEHVQSAQPRHGMPPVVVSREYGSGGMLIAKGIAQRLGFQLFDRDLLDRMAERGHVPPDLIHLLDERPGRSLAVFGASLLHGGNIGPKEFATLLRGTIQAILDLGNAVVLGRGASFIAKPHKALRLRVVAPLELRIHRIAELEQIDAKAAAKQIHDIEERRRKFHHQYFGTTDVLPENFDLAINTQTINLAQAVEIALRAYEVVCGVALPENSAARVTS